jgi:hypothetical protein
MSWKDRIIRLSISPSQGDDPGFKSRPEHFNLRYNKLINHNKIGGNGNKNAIKYKKMTNSVTSKPLPSKKEQTIVSHNNNNSVNPNSVSREGFWTNFKDYLIAQE